MQKMKELYEKVAADSTLQAKFEEIMKDAETAGKEITEGRLIDFAEDCGFHISIEEMREFFSEKSKEAAGELNEAELDQVAGGKSSGGDMLHKYYSLATVGVGCAVMSALSNTFGEYCSEMWEGIAKS